MHGITVHEDVYTLCMSICRPSSLFKTQLSDSPSAQQGSMVFHFVAGVLHLHVQFYFVRTVNASHLGIQWSPLVRWSRHLTNGHSPELDNFKRDRHYSNVARSDVRYGLIILNVARSDAVSRKSRRAQRGRTSMSRRCRMLCQYTN